MLATVKNLALKKSFWVSVIGILTAAGVAISPELQAALMGLMEAVLG